MNCPSIGDRVEYHCNMRCDNRYDGEPASVIDVHGNEITIQFDDGHQLQVYPSNCAWIPSDARMERHMALIRRRNIRDLAEGNSRLGRPKRIDSALTRRGSEYRTT